MKKWGNAVAVLIVLALVVWAGSRFSTAVVRVLSLLDAGDGLGETQLVAETEEPGIEPAASWAPSDQDYDEVTGVPESVEEERPRATDYLNDGTQEHPVDKTAEELAEELESAP